MPWSRLIALIEPHYPKGKTGRPPFPVSTMLHIHFMQQWFVVWLYKDAVPGIGEEHRADHDSVCAGQTLDGAQGFRQSVKRPARQAASFDKRRLSWFKSWTTYVLGADSAADTSNVKEIGALKTCCADLP